jgi:hypothetical protein
MLTEKELLDRIPLDLREAFSAVLERYQRHLLIVETEVAQIRDVLAKLHPRLSRPLLTTIRPPSSNRSRGNGEVEAIEEHVYVQPERAFSQDW